MWIILFMWSVAGAHEVLWMNLLSLFLRARSFRCVLFVCLFAARRWWWWDCMLEVLMWIIKASEFWLSKFFPLSLRLSRPRVTWQYFNCRDPYWVSEKFTVIWVCGCKYLKANTILRHVGCTILVSRVRQSFYFLVFLFLTFLELSGSCEIFLQRTYIYI